MGTNKGTAFTVDFSLRKIVSEDSFIILYSYAIDARGEDVGIGLVEELQKVNHIHSGIFYGITYSLHALNLILCSPVNKYIGIGGNQKRILLQMLYTCYAIQDEFELVEFQQI
jgi:hypothetical protein